MSKVTVAAIQMTYGLETAVQKVEEAAAQGAQIILLPELFENWYFCQEKNYENYHLATTLEENPAVNELKKVARDFRVVLPVSYYERVGNTTFNTVAVIDADGSVLGQYRKTHIPDDHFYQEKFYFTPGDTGFRVWDTAYARIGVGICWDQWFPESARCMALMGAELLFYPAPSRFWTATPCRTGGAACRGTRPRISCRSLRPTALAPRRSRPRRITRTSPRR